MLNIAISFFANRAGAADLASAHHFKNLSGQGSLRAKVLSPERSDYQLNLRPQNSELRVANRGNGKIGFLAPRKVKQ